ncbi:MAG: hypothetical protein HZA54_14265, partial [Planctomycetes bacterium]|nr:hypothetical protein [Planctomycetota bacterium]
MNCEGNMARPGDQAMAEAAIREGYLRAEEASEIEAARAHAEATLGRHVSFEQVAGEQRWLAAN